MNDHMTENPVAVAMRRLATITEALQVARAAAARAEIESDPELTMLTKIANEIVSALGAGHTESVYHNAMKIGLRDAGLKYESERDLPISFRGEYVGTVRADLIIEKRHVIELKSASGSEKVVTDAEEQCICYMKETGITVGTVIVFPKRAGDKLVVRNITI